MAGDKAVTVSVLGPAETDEWAAFVRSSSLGSAYSLPAYLEALAEAVGGSVQTFVARRGESLAGGIGVLRQALPIGAYAAPRLLAYYNGFVLRDYESRYGSQRVGRRSETVAALGQRLVEEGFLRLEIRSRSPLDDVRPLLAAGWRVSPSYSYVVPLENLDSLWGRMDQNLRRLVERARSLGVELEIDGEFDSFYDLHVATAGRKGAPVYLPRPSFVTFYERLAAAGLCTLYHARDSQGAVVASQLVLLGHPVTHTVAAAADPRHQKTGANPFLRWSVFEHLSAQGYTANDLTDATLGPVARFKSQLGGDLVHSLVAGRPTSLLYEVQRVALGGARRVRSLAGVSS